MTDLHHFGSMSSNFLGKHIPLHPVTAAPHPYTLRTVGILDPPLYYVLFQYALSIRSIYFRLKLMIKKPFSVVFCFFSLFSLQYLLTVIQLSLFSKCLNICFNTCFVLILFFIFLKERFKSIAVDFVAKCNVRNIYSTPELCLLLPVLSCTFQIVYPTSVCNIYSSNREMINV